MKLFGDITSFRGCKLILKNDIIDFKVKWGGNYERVNGFDD